MSVASDRAKARGATTRGRSSSGGSKNPKSSSSASTRARNSSARATKNNQSRSATKNNQSRSSRPSSKKTQSPSQQGQSAQQTQSAQQRNGHAGRVWTSAGISALTAAIGIAGGVVLGRNTARRDRKVLGVPVPEKIDLGGIGQQIGDAGRQLGKLASEVRTVREKAEQVGRILT